MYTVEQLIELQSFNKLKIEKIKTSDTLDILSISLEKGMVFPEHKSPRDAFLIMMEGKVRFHIMEEVYTLSKYQHLNFKKDQSHWVEALENAKFLIIR